MEVDNEKLKKFCESKHLQVLMNIGRDDKVLLFKIDGTHKYVSKERFEQMLNRKRDPRPDKDINADRNWDDWSVEYKDILYSNMKYVYAVI